MKTLIVYQDGKRGWGKRIKKFIADNSPQQWHLQTLLMNSVLPDIIDEPGNFIPQNMPEIDLLIVLAENSGLAQLIPDFVVGTNAQALISPVDNEKWFPRGLQNQIKEKLEKINVDYVFPRPFCSFVASSKAGEFIKEFNRYFGRPVVSITCENNSLVDYKIEKESPCGVISDVMEKLVGTELSDLDRQAGLYHQYYPCLASVDLIHSSAHITEAVIKNELKKELNIV